MSQLITIRTDDATPIWRQIELGMRRLISRGLLAPGAAVPSVRELSRELSVNPATVSRAYRELQRAELLIARRGEGSFVSEQLPDQDLHADVELATGARRFATLAQALEFDLDNASKELQDQWGELELQGDSQ